MNNANLIALSPTSGVAGSEAIGVHDPGAKMNNVLYNAVDFGTQK